MKQKGKTSPGLQLVAKTTKKPMRASKRGQLQPHIGALEVAANAMEAHGDLDRAARETNMVRDFVLLAVTRRLGQVALRALDKAQLALQLHGGPGSGPGLVVREYLAQERIGPQSTQGGVFIERRRSA